MQPPVLLPDADNGSPARLVYSEGNPADLNATAPLAGDLQGFSPLGASLCFYGLSEAYFQGAGVDRDGGPRSFVVEFPSNWTEKVAGAAVCFPLEDRSTFPEGI